LSFALVIVPNAPVFYFRRSVLGCMLKKYFGNNKSNYGWTILSGKTNKF
jgi:hypothetical protein